MTHYSPSAKVVLVEGRTVTVQCPYCGHKHRHQLPEAPLAGRTERFAPKCGLYRTALQRQLGYQFSIPTETLAQNRRRRTRSKPNRTIERDQTP